MPANPRPRSPSAEPAQNARPHNPLKFELEPYHRNIPDQELIQDLCRVARMLQAGTLTQSAYKKHGRFNALTLSSRFGSWNASLLKANLRPSRHFRVSAGEVLADIRRVATDLKTRELLETQYVRLGNYSMTLIYRHFRNWDRALQAAGLAPSKYHPRATDQQLFGNLEHLWRLYSHQPRCTQLKPPHSRFGLTPYQRRFGNYQNAIRAFVHWKKNHPCSGSLASPSVMIGSPCPQPHQTTRSINFRLRYLILSRDHFRCRACGRSPATQPNVRLHVDHVKPWSKGGETLQENLQTLCDRCNIGKCNL